MLKLKNVSRKLALKYAAFPPTMPSASDPNAAVPAIPKAPRVPIIEEAPNSAPFSYNPQSDFEVKTPRLDGNLPPMASEMFNDTGDSDLPTMRPERLMQLSDYQTKLITALDGMHMNNLITGIYHQKAVQEVQRSNHDAHLYELHKEIKKTLHNAEVHALEYAAKMKNLLKHID